MPTTLSDFWLIRETSAPAPLETLDFDWNSRPESRLSTPLTLPYSSLAQPASFLDEKFAKLLASKAAFNNPSYNNIGISQSTANAHSHSRITIRNHQPAELQDRPRPGELFRLEVTITRMKKFEFQLALYILEAPYSGPAFLFFLLAFARAAKPWNRNRELAAPDSTRGRSPLALIKPDVSSGDNWKFSPRSSESSGVCAFPGILAPRNC